MAINKNKINDNALKYIQKGQVKKAIREYEKILAEDPNDVRTLLKKGDLLVRVGEKAQAVDTYLKVASTYSQQGFHLKAVAVFKQILKIDEGRIDVNLRLAEEYQNLGIAGDAMAHLQIVAAYYDQQGMARESLDIFRRIVDLDPENVASRIKLAELYSREGLVEEAAEEFTRAAEDLKAANRVEDYIKVAERLIYHDATNLVLVKELANIYLQRGDTKRALGKLQVCFKSDPRDLETLGMLAMAFQDLNQLSKTVSVYKEMAKIYQEQDAEDEMQQVYRRVLEIAPDDPEANQALAASGAGAAGTVGAVAPPAEGEMTLEQSVSYSQPTASDSAYRPDLEAGSAPELEPDYLETEISSPLLQEAPLMQEVDIPSAEVVLSEPAVMEQPTLLEQEVPGRATAEPMSEQSRELVSRLLTETDVYIKYGLQSKAIEHLNRIFQLDPHNIEAHDKLKDLYINAEQMDHAAQELVTLIQITMHHGRTEKARAYVRSLLGIAPDHREGRAYAEQLGEAVPAANEPFLEEIPLPPIDPASPDVMVLDEDGMVGVGSGDAFELIETGEALPTEETAEGMAEYAEDSSGASIDIVEDVPIDFDAGSFGEEEPVEPDEASTVLADREHFNLDSLDSYAPRSGEPAVPPELEELPPLDYEGTEETVEATSLPTGVYAEGMSDDLMQVADPLEAPDLSESEVDFDGIPDLDEPIVIQEPEVVELVDDADVQPIVSPSLDDEPELIEFTGEEEFFVEEVQPEDDLPSQPNTLVTEVAPPRPAAPLLDEVDPSEMSTMVGMEQVPRKAPIRDGGRSLDAAAVNLEPAQDTAPARPVRAVQVPEPEPVEEEAEDEEEFSDALEEVDFFIQQNLLDEASDELERLKETYPDRPEVQERLEQVARLQQGETPVAQLGADEMEGAFDLASEIEREAGDDAAPMPLDEDFQYSVEDVFGEFKKGVERVVSREDSTTHFDLGIAYKEMGLIDDAISEFTIVAQDAAKKAAALSMIGLCFVEKGQYSEAINKFKDALHGQGISEQETTGVYYEMGQTYELLEDVEEALFYYRKVLKRDAKFRDVAARLKALSKPGGATGDKADTKKSSSSKNKISYM